MTPGFAKSRAELPYLYYPRNDRVIINAHNFTSVFNPAVNGKSPIAAWVPSRDTAGNGTTTLTDLVGSSNGTLTNMATPAANWVSDTSSGGVRAITIDGVNDYVASNESTQWHKSNCAFSCWVYYTGNGNAGYGTVLSRDNGSNQWIFLSRDNASYGGRLSLNCYDGANNPSVQSSGVLALSAWHHVGFSISSNTATLYVNGSAAGSGSIATWTRPTLTGVQLGRWGASGGGRPMDGRIDDLRLFNQALTASDFAFLATSRGVSS